MSDAGLLSQVKRDARRMCKQQPPGGLTHTQCLEAVAKQHGFRTYAALKAAAEHIDRLAKPALNSL